MTRDAVKQPPSNLNPRRSSVIVYYYPKDFQPQVANESSPKIKVDNTVVKKSEHPPPTQTTSEIPGMSLSVYEELI